MSSAFHPPTFVWSFTQISILSVYQKKEKISIGKSHVTVLIVKIAVFGDMDLF